MRKGRSDDRPFLLGVSRIQSAQIVTVSAGIRRADDLAGASCHAAPVGPKRLHLRLHFNAIAFQNPSSRGAVSTANDGRIDPQFTIGDETEQVSVGIAQRRASVQEPL
jgi:hypothetical protein